MPGVKAIRVTWGDLSSMALFLSPGFVMVEKGLLRSAEETEYLIDIWSEEGPGADSFIWDRCESALKHLNVTAGLRTDHQQFSVGRYKPIIVIMLCLIGV